MSSAVSGHKGRDRWMCAILTRDVLPLLEVRVAVRLGIFFNCKTGKCDPGYETLASELGISRRTLFRALARLKADGWIEIHRVGRDEYVQFSLFIPPQLAPPSEVLPARGANILSPLEVPTSWHLSEPPESPQEVTENGVRGDTQTGSTREPENLKLEDRPSKTTGTESDHTHSLDRPIPEPRAREPLTPVPHAYARTEPVAAQNPRTSRLPEMGTGANGPHAGVGTMREGAYAALWQVYPNQTYEGDAPELFYRLLDQGVDPDMLIAAAAVYARRCEGIDPVRIKLLCYWLRVRGWEDENRHLLNDGRDRARGRR
jgi:hypothetical protein